MLPAIHAAPEIVAILTAARPDLMREISGSLGFSPSTLSDPWEAAVENSSLLSGAVDESPAGQAASAFAQYLRSHTKRERFAKDSTEAFLRIQLSKGANVVSAAFLNDSGYRDEIHQAFLKHGLDDRAATKATGLLSQFFPEYEAAQKSWSFGYSVGPFEQGEFEKAAAACGGAPYVGSNRSNDLAIINLPFSAFVGTTDEVDPTVVQAIEDSQTILKNAKNVLFRVEWTIGNRLQSSLTSYRKFLANRFPKLEFRSFISESFRFDPLLDGAEAFIAGATAWNDKFRPVEVLVSDLKGGSSKHNAPVLESAIRGLLRAV